MDEEFNATQVGGILTSDPPRHTVSRRIMNDQLSPRAMRGLEPSLQDRADALVSILVARGSFDAVRDLAQAYSCEVIFDFVGLPEEGRELLLPGASAGFNLQGPANERFVSSGPDFKALMRHARDVAVPGRLSPHGKGAQIYGAAREGVIDEWSAAGLMLSYTWAGIDTTVNGIANAVRLFAEHPDQWDLVRRDPALIPDAFSEVLRLESPVQVFTRSVADDTEVAGVPLKSGSRVMVMYGSANRDERKYPDPERFDVLRRPTDNLAFGHGIHVCVGMTLARMEAHTVLRALASRVERMTIASTSPRLNNTLRGPEVLEVRVS
ncbi:MAG: cytochrome P450 [Dehalococcoidia bacterium]|nr:cytochrome P450 [Dehalococcoidia bacterium]